MRSSDYNYERQSDGSCTLVPGLAKPNAVEYCKENPDAIEYWEPTGFRRIPLTTCVGGKNLDRWESRPCPGHQEEYERKHGTSGVVIFFAVIVPIVIAIAVGYWVYTHWDGKFGQIQLGEGGAQSFITSRVSLAKRQWLCTVTRQQGSATVRDESRVCVQEGRLYECRG